MFNVSAPSLPLLLYIRKLSCHILLVAMLSRCVSSFQKLFKVTEGNGLSPMSFYMADKTEPYFLMPKFFQTSMSSLLCTLYASIGFFITVLFLHVYVWVFLALS